MKDERPTISISSVSTEKNNTGSWRTMRPIVDPSKCKGRGNTCGRCELLCADCSIDVDDKGNISIDLIHCKGCGVCANECPRNAITMTPEVDCED